MTVILEGYIKVPLEELETIKNNLDEHIQNTLIEHGCLEFTVEQDGIDECVFNVFEENSGVKGMYLLQSILQTS